MQSVFIQKLREVIPPNLALADEMADILEISNDSAYRRIRCETEVSIDEVYKLANKYKLSLDGIFSNLNDTVTFTYTSLIDSQDHLDRYLSRLFGHVQLVNSYPEKKNFYVADTFPLFYSFFSKKLCEFKLFFWQRSVLNVPAYQGRKFEFGFVPEQQVNLAMDASKVYNRIPGIEVWTTETVNTNLKQLEYYVESGVFQKASDALLILDELKVMIESLEKWATQGRKDENLNDDSFQFYCSDVELGSNCIYIQAGPARYAYVSFNTLNSLYTNNQVFCEEMEHWVKNIVQKSTLISGIAEKQRFRFFSRIYTYISDCRERISKH